MRSFGCGPLLLPFREDVIAEVVCNERQLGVQTSRCSAAMIDALSVPGNTNTSAFLCTVGVGSGPRREWMRRSGNRTRSLHPSMSGGWALKVAGRTSLSARRRRAKARPSQPARSRSSTQKVRKPNFPRFAGILCVEVAGAARRPSRVARDVFRRLKSHCARIATTLASLGNRRQLQ